MSLTKRQIAFITAGVVLAPALPFLYLQGQYTRWKVGRLPDAAGETIGTYGTGEGELNILAIGESTVAGIGAKDHAEAMAGQLAKFVSQRTGKPVRWHVCGESGITIRGTIERLFPKTPDVKMDYVFIALGGNDIFKLSTPQKWKRDYSELIGLLQNKYPGAKIKLANVPRIDSSPVIPHPLKALLWEISKIHRATTREMVAGMKDVYYYESRGKVEEGFYADGVHPSPHGYSLWAEGIVNSLFDKLK